MRSLARICILASALAALAAADGRTWAGGRAPATPEPPRAFVDTSPVAVSGRTHSVGPGGDLQAALDAAQPGDVVVLTAGATFSGPVVLPAKPGAGWIVVRTSTSDASLPPGRRVTSADAPLMPKIEAASEPVIAAAPGAHHYRLVGLEIRPRAGAFLRNLVTLGTAETAVEQLPHDIIVERCYLHGDPVRGARRGIALNSRATAVIDSHLADFMEAGADSQALAGWNGPGPFKIVNNRLEAAGENLMFGGADPSIRGLVPADIEVRRNHFVKPLAWKPGEAGHRGTAWTVKNLFELKNARRVVVAGNVFEHNWAQAQSGFAVLLTVRNQDGGAPWSVVEDVVFESNLVRGAASGINILGRDSRWSEQTRRIAIRNNLLLDVGGERWGGAGTLVQILDGTADVVVEHNTALQTGNIVMAEGRPHTGFVFRNNIVLHNRYGIIGTGTGSGRHTLTTYFPGAAVQKNVVVGGSPALHPPDNFFPDSLGDVGFVDLAGGDYRLKPTSRYRRAGTDGEDLGVDVDALNRALVP